MPAKKKTLASAPKVSAAPPTPLEELARELNLNLAKPNGDRLREAERRLLKLHIQEKASGNRRGPEGNLYEQLLRVEIAIYRMAR